MSGRFTLDLLHPGRVGQSWLDWFVSNQGRRRLAACGVSVLGVSLLGLLGGILPTYWRLSVTLQQIPQLEKDLASADRDLRELKLSLRAFSAEAARQIRWAELLNTFSRHLPPTLRLQRVELSTMSPVGTPGQQVQQPAPPAEGSLRLEAVTPLRPGNSALLEIAQFMVSLMRDPAVNGRFELKRWEIKPPPREGPLTEGPRMLEIGIVLAPRAS